MAAERLVIQVIRDLFLESIGLADEEVGALS
jgi:hypothetical protein